MYLELRLLKIYTFSLLFFSFFVFCGPFNYYIYSNQYFMMFYIYQIIFAMGLLIGGIFTNKKKHEKKMFFNMTLCGERICLCLCFISMFSFLFEINMIITAVSTTTQFSFLGSYYGALVQSMRSIIDRLLLITMHLGGEVVFLIVHSMACVRHNLLKKISIICLWLPGIYYILQGARFMLAVEFFIFVFTVTNNKYKQSYNKQKIIMCILAVILFACFMILFSARQVYFTPLTKYHFIPGDMSLKPWASLLYQSNSRLFLPIFELCDYLAQAPYVFSHYMEFYKPRIALYGLGLLRPINQILTLFNSGINISALVQNHIIAGGKYSGFCYSLNIDFGAIGSFFAAFFIGYAMSKIYEARNRSLFARCVSPCIISSIIFAPVYYFNVGRLDFITILILIMLIVLKPCIFKSGILNKN